MIFSDPQRMIGMSDNQNYKRKIEIKHLKKIYSYYLIEDYTMMWQFTKVMDNRD